MTAAEQVAYHLIYSAISFTGEDNRVTIGLFSDVGDVFKAIHAEDTDSGDNYEVFIIRNHVPRFPRPDQALKFTWNKLALADKHTNTIIHVMPGFEDKITAISKLQTDIKELRTIVDKKLKMVKSLMNLDAKNTKAPISASVFVSGYIDDSVYRPSSDYSNSSQLNPDTFYEQRVAEHQRLKYQSHLLDEWVGDLKTQTGFDGELTELVATVNGNLNLFVHTIKHP